MEFCTNCGAAAREDAKFCTNCGARLESHDSAQDPTPQTTSDATDTYDTVEYIPESDTSEAESASAEDTADEQNQPSDDYAATWLTAENAPGDTAADPEIATVSDSMAAEASDTNASPEASPSENNELAAPYVESWPSADEPEDEPFGQDPPVSSTAEIEGTNWPAPPETAAPTADEDEGPSNWESWAPTPDPEAAVSLDASNASGDDDDALLEIRGLVDTLQRRLDQMASPTPVTSRGVDADELADQLNGWVHDAPSSADLLDVVRDARANPRDIDALTRLADRAEELERLVEHYGTICTDAERWVARLRHHDDWTTA